MKTAKHFLSIILIFAFLPTLIGCDLVSVNVEKDRQTVVAKVGEEKILKGEVTDYINFLKIMYLSYGYNFTEDAEEIQTLKENILESIIDYRILKSQNNLKIDVDEASVKADTEDAIESIKTAFAENENTDIKYKETLNEYGFTEESFYETIYNYTLLSEYTLNFSENFSTENLGGEYTTNTILKVNDFEIPAYYFYYYMIQEEILLQLSSETMPTDEKELTKLKEKIIETLTQNAALIVEGENQSITFSDEEIEQKTSKLGYDLFYGEDSILALAKDTYCMTSEQYNSAKKWTAKAELYKEKLIEKETNDTISEADVKKYFKKNKEKYNQSTVSAMHILVSDKSTSKEIYSTIVNSGESFETMAEEYSEYEEVTVEDLGPFVYADMVEDFSKAAFDMKIGEISKPIKTEYGYHIIYVYDKSESEEPEFEDYKDEIKETLIEEAKVNNEEKYLERLVKNVKTSDELLIDTPYNTYMNNIKEELNVKEYKNKL